MALLASMLVFTFVDRCRKGASCTPLDLRWTIVNWVLYVTICCELVVLGFLPLPFFDIFELMSEQAEQGFYFVGKHYSTLLKQKLQSLIGDEEPSPQTVEVIMGRKLQVL
jgi:hypothetical protein